MGSIYSKLEEIRIMNANLKLENITDEDILREITYPCSVAELMGRKIKSMIETAIIQDNKKICFNIRNRYYKRFVILLYYYAIFTFYSSRNKLSQNFENENLDDFTAFCQVDTSYSIEHIMVTSKIVELNIETPGRNFKIVHFDGLRNYLLNNYYSK